METEQLYAGEKPVCPTTNYENDNAAEKMEEMKSLLDAIAETVANKLLEKTEIADWAKQQTKPSYTAGEVGADAEGSAGQALASAKSYADDTYTQATGYTDVKIANLINGAPSTLDTLKEIADAMLENESVVDALAESIGTKASDVEAQAHYKNQSVHVSATEKENIAKGVEHAVTIATDEGLGHVKPDNKTIVAMPDGTIKANFANVIEIKSGEDLYNYKNPGFYACYMSATAMTLKNCPVKRAFFMIVGKHAGTYQEIMEYVPRNPKRFMRNYYYTDDVWGPDYRVYTQADPPPANVATDSAAGIVKPDNLTIKAAADGTLSTQYIKKIPIETGTDMNDYYNLGFYACSFNSDAGELANRPINSQFGMVVLPTFGIKNSVCQLIVENVIHPRILIRIISPESKIYGDWIRLYTIENTGDLTKLITNHKDTFVNAINELSLKSSSMKNYVSIRELGLTVDQKYTCLDVAKKMENGSSITIDTYNIISDCPESYQYGTLTITRVNEQRTFARYEKAASLADPDVALPPKIYNRFILISKD